MSRGRFIRFAALIAAAAVGWSAALAQSPTQDPLDMLRNLTPEQRAAIESTVGGQATGGTRDQNSQRREGQQTPADTPLRTLDEESRRELEESARKILRGEDTVVIEIDFKLLPLVDEVPNNTLPPTIQGQPGALPATGAPANANGAPTNPLLQSSPRVVRQLGEADINQLADLRDLVRSRNPYRLTREGLLLLPGMAGIPLGGLTEQQATLRLKIEPVLQDLDVRVRRLPLRRLGVEKLKPFGYELFERAPSTFAPVTDVPVPSDYVVGAGDEIEVQLYGNQNRTLHLTVGRDGRVSFPELGPIAVAGQSFSAAKSSIEARVARQMIGVRANVSMGDTRAIRVLVVGEARSPGSYTISGLGTITSALYAAGGVKPIGSLRNIELKRNGAVVRRFDLYDLLLRGDTSDDAKLLPGDVVFIPPVGPTVGVDGEVRRPAIYELNGETSVTDLVKLAGGLTAESDLTNGALTRIDPTGNRVVLNVQLGAGGDSQPVRNGDLLRVSRLRPTLDAGINLQGHVFAEGAFAYRQGLRLSDVLRSVDDLKPDADPHYILIRRELPPERRIVAVSADLTAALAAPGSDADTPLMPRDRIIVFDSTTNREHVIRPLLEEIRQQSNFLNPTAVVHVDGRTKQPGDYPLEAGMTVRDLVRAGGSLSDAAYGGKAELTRYKVVDGEQRRTELISLDLTAAMRGDPGANLRLQPFDSLSIKEIPDWGEQETVQILGEVRFPGRYAISRGETMRSVLKRAGGLSELAFPSGSVFTREELREREQVQLEQLTERLRKDLAVLALQSAAANQSQAGTAVAVGENLMTQLRASKAVGRLVINLPRVMSGADPVDDVILRNGDKLMVPKLRQEVTVIGEVQSPTSQLYRAGLTRDDYISLSGGMTRKADKSKAYIVRADGSVIASAGNSWFARSAQVGMQPGDTVVVPLDTERMPALPFWQAVTQIVYNLAISAAAVNSF
ncbi:MAG TPA: SLBB domain-containing protein [Steroidobacteraceae bacterium]|nr:SLBB domain-containing protein [Steroidobacteraceae bacterium]